MVVSGGDISCSQSLFVSGAVALLFYWHVAAGNKRNLTADLFYSNLLAFRDKLLVNNVTFAVL